MSFVLAKTISIRWIVSSLLLASALTLASRIVIAPYFDTRAEVCHSVIRVRGVDREYRLVIPDCTRGERNRPVLIVLHGALSTTDEMAALTDLDRLAARHGCLLVYLQGCRLSWPAVNSPEHPEYLHSDLEFFDAVCDATVTRYAADRSRNYLVGVSQGGAMCNLLVAMRSERIAAAVCNCGWMPEPFDVQPLHTPHKTPMLFLVGSRDVQVSPQLVKQARDIFAAAGHPVEYKVLDGAEHGWNKESGVNELVWQFVSGKKL